MQLKKEYDVFIAYHGSYEQGGSAGFAENLYNYLSQHGRKCFFFRVLKRIRIRQILSR